MNSVKRYKCPSCGSGLSFNPISQNWKCDFCNTEFTRNQLENASDSQENLNESMTELNTYHCSSCGAELIADDTTSATFCLYCRNHSIIKTRFSGRFKPEKVIPFRITKEQAKEIYKKWISKKIFSPGIFKNKDEIDKISGIYAPYWLFDCDVQGYIEGEATKVKTWISGNYKYTNTKYYQVARGGGSGYSKIPVDASIKLDDHFMYMIEPYNYNAITDFSMEYMSGFLAEKYDVEVDEAEITMKKRVEKFMEDRLKETVNGYSSFSVREKSFNVSDISNKYAMLPIYLLNNKYKEKDHIFIINGQTGKIVGDTPISIQRQIGLTAVLFVVLWIIVGFGGALFV